MSTAIEFNHESKQYRLVLVSTRTLSHDLDSIEYNYGKIYQ